ncbi:golgin subfamily A member 2-like [Macrobrachium nipponense]|uniref:golgin subfamily A member 2-like n=1 Tax=Macrobrachium nipponense TaxID=159736 RepID=UPI0030C7C846
MADSVRDQKLAAARKKLRQFQKKKGTRRVAENISKESTPDVEGNATEESSLLSESGTLSSRASSVDLASEDFPDPSHDVKIKDNTIFQGCMALPADHYINGETTNSSCTPVAEHEPPDHAQPEALQKHSIDESNVINSTQIHPDVSVAGMTPAFTTPIEIVPGPTNITQPNLGQVFGGVPDRTYENTVNGIVGVMHQPTASADNQQSSLASYFQTNASQSDPFAFISETSSGDVVSQVDTSYKNFVSPEEHMPVVASPTVIEPDDIDSQDCTESDNTTSHQELTSSSADIPEQPKEDVPEATAPTKTTDYSDRQSAVDFIDRDGSVSSETTASVTTAIHLTAGDQTNQPILKSSSESLRQISLQLSGLMSETEGAISDSANLTITELERRNSELAALLQQERQTSQQQAQHIDQMKAQLERVEAELSAAQGVLNSSAGGGVREIESMREQLQVHIQTIGILVSEKSELQSSLTHANHALKQKAGEVSELDGRLSASRQRVSELESSLKDLTSQYEVLKDQQTNVSKDLDTNKMSNFKLSKLCEELRASVAELTERLSVKTKDYEQLGTQLADTKSQLAMAQLHVQQLRDGTSDEIRAQLEQVQASHAESQRQLAAAEAALSQARTENAQVASQYQQYTTKLAEESQTLQQKVDQLTVEKESLSENLEDMKRKLESSLTVTPSGGISEEALQSERENFNKTIATLQEEMHQLQEQNNAMTSDNSQLSKLVDQLSCNLEELEMKLERTKTEEVDTSRLLAAMQSDKVAAARALTQNKQLKEQLEELQSGFIIMSNKKLELTEKLEKELYVKKNLNQEIASLNEQLANLGQQMVEKDREMTSLKENAESLGTQLMLLRSQTHTPAERGSEGKQSSEEIMKYQELIQQLEEKLRTSNDQIQQVTAKNTELQTLISDYNKQMSKPTTENLPNGNASDETASEAHKELILKVANLTTYVNELEAERNQLKTHLEEERSKKAAPKPEGERSDPASPDVEFNPEVFTNLKEAHEALEKRFSRSMDKVAELSDEKQNLEHIIQQLQVENDSIGDYITIYQFQRGVMKQQARERELELSSLKHEREEMKIKLATLQELMASLAQEKGHDQQQLMKMETVIKQQPTTLTNVIDPVVNGTTTEENHVEVAEEPSEKPAEEENESGKSSTSESNAESTFHINGAQELPAKGKDTTAKSPTVQRILDLLNEMEATSQMEHCGLQKFHPCPLCSGKLITV